MHFCMQLLETILILIYACKIIIIVQIWSVFVEHQYPNVQVKISSNRPTSNTRMIASIAQGWWYYTKTKAYPSLSLFLLLKNK